MIPDLSSQSVPEGAADREPPTRREVLAAATALLASAAASSPAQAAVGAEGYFLTFDVVTRPGLDVDRVFFIPSAWLELFEVTDVYKARYTTAQWNQVLARMRSGMAHAKRIKFSALYADSTDSGVQEPFPGLTVIPPVPPSANQTYLASMIDPGNIPP